MKPVQLFFFVSLIVLVVSAAISCDNLDVVARDAVTSFASLTSALQPVTLSGGNGFEMSAADNDKVVFRDDWSGDEDIVVDLNAAPLTEAGLDPSRLPDRFRFDASRSRLGILFNLGTAQPDSQASTLDALFVGVVKQYRDRIGYHEEFDHYGLGLGDGNMLEWAKDFASNDKDFVFVLDPAPLLAAGLNPKKLSGGWVLGTVTVKGADGKPAKVDKLLKPYNVM